MYNCLFCSSGRSNPSLSFSTAKHTYTKRLLQENKTKNQQITTQASSKSPRWLPGAPSESCDDSIINSNKQRSVKNRKRK